MTGNTILITGGATGIGRALAESFHAAGNKVIIAGRRRAPRDETVAANPGMAGMALDIEDADAIARFAEQVVTDHPALNVVINNAGIMKPETLVDGSQDLELAAQIVNTNLLGPMRPHHRPDAASSPPAQSVGDDRLLRPRLRAAGLHANLLCDPRPPSTRGRNRYAISCATPACRCRN